jgi:hypothetical protein
MVKNIVQVGNQRSGSVIYFYGSGPFHLKAKNEKKTLISSVLRLLYDCLSLKNDLNVTSKKKKKKLEKKIIFCWHPEGH